MLLNRQIDLQSLYHLKSHISAAALVTYVKNHGKAYIGKPVSYMSDRLVFLKSS